MSRSRSKFNDRYYEGNKRRSTRNSNRYDESDESSYFSLEDSTDGNRGSRLPYNQRKNSRDRFDIDDLLSVTDSDDSYAKSKRRTHKDSYRHRSGSKSRLTLDSDSPSESDDSDVYIFHESARNLGNRSQRGRVRRGKGSRTFSDSESASDSDSDYRCKFSSRSERRRRDSRHLYSSNGDSRSDSQSSYQFRKPDRTLQRSGSDPNLVQSDRRSVGSRARLASSTGQNPSSFNASMKNVEQKPLAASNGNDPRLLRSSSLRSMTGMRQNYFPSNQCQVSGAMTDTRTLNQGTGNMVPGVGLRRISSGSNFLGNTNPQLPIGPGNLGRSMSSQSRNAREQFNRSSRDVMTYMNNQPKPQMMMESSQRSLGNNHALLRNATNSLRSELIRTASQRSVGNNEALVKDAIQQQASRWTNEVPKMGMPNNSVRSIRSGLIGVASQRSPDTSNSLGGYNTMPSQRPVLTRAVSQRNTASNNRLLHPSTHYDSNTMITGPKQSQSGIENTRSVKSRTYPRSVVGDCVSVLSGMSGDTSVIPRRKNHTESLADQISSRNRNGDVSSIGSYGDPPGVDINHLKKRRKQVLLDNSSYETFGDDQESFASHNDPPDMFEEDQSYSNGTRDESEPEEESEESFGSYTDQDVSISDVESSATGSSDEDDKIYYRVRPSRTSSTSRNGSYYRQPRVPLSESSVSSDSSDDSSSSDSSQMKVANAVRPPLRFSSDISFEYDQQIQPPRRIYSSDSSESSRDSDSDDIIITSDHETTSWFNRQISNRKLVDRKCSPHSSFEYDQDMNATRRSVSFNNSDRAGKSGGTDTDNNENHQKTSKSEPDRDSWFSRQISNRKLMNSDSCSHSTVEYEQDLNATRDFPSPNRSESPSDDKSTNNSIKTRENEDLVAPSEPEPVSWLARQISNRKLMEKNSSTRSLEPKGMIVTGLNDPASSDPYSNGHREDPSSNSKSSKQNAHRVAESRRKSKGETVESISFDESANPQSEIGYVLKYGNSDEGVPSLAKVDVGLDDPTSTTDTMSQEIPSVIISKKSDADGGYRDTDSLLSFPTIETKGERPTTKFENEYETGKNDVLKERKTEKTTSSSSKKKKKKKKKDQTRSSVSTKKTSKEKTSKKKKKKGGDESNKNKTAIGDSLNEVNEHGIDLQWKQKGRKSKNKISMTTKSDTDHGSTKSKSSKKKIVAKDETNQELLTDKINKNTDESVSSTSRKLKGRQNKTMKGSKLKVAQSGKPKKETGAGSKNSMRQNLKLAKKSSGTANNLDENEGFEDKSVMNLIDKLKAYELK